MRGAFVHTYDAYYGPLSTMGAPNTQYVFSQPCRFVPQTKIFQVQEPFDLADAWMTHDAPSLNGPDVLAPWVPATFSDYLTADQVVVSAHPTKRFVYCRSEFVNPVVRPSYWRGLLIDVAKLVSPPWLPPSPLPPPPPPPPACGLLGASCPLAGTSLLGTLCPYTIGSGVVVWLRWVTSGAGPRSSQTNQTAGACQYDWFHGTGCGALVPIATVFGTAVVPWFSGPPVDDCWCRITGVGASNSFTVGVF